MDNYLIKLRDIPAWGLTLEISDQTIWTQPIEEFKLQYKIKQALKSKVKLQVEGNVCIIKGFIEGSLVVPCDRCVENSTIYISETFKIIEEPLKKDTLDISFIIEKDGELFIDLAGILWERLMLNIPSKVLCSEDCKGLCPYCGTNRNLDQCNCKEEMLDPRLEVLRKIKIS